jgi:hypothetical protein
MDTLKHRIINNEIALNTHSDSVAVSHNNILSVNVLSAMTVFYFFVHLQIKC